MLLFLVKNLTATAVETELNLLNVSAHQLYERFPGRFDASSSKLAFTAKNNQSRGRTMSKSHAFIDFIAYTVFCFLIRHHSVKRLA